MPTAVLTKSSTGAWLTEAGDLVEDLEEVLDALPAGATLELSVEDEDDLDEDDFGFADEPEDEDDVGAEAPAANEPFAKTPKPGRRRRPNGRHFFE